MQPSPAALEAPGRVDPQRATLIAVAWTGTLLLSRLPQILLREIGGIDLSTWIVWISIGVGVALSALTLLWSAIRPLRRYFAVMTVIYAATALMSSVTGTALWRGWFGAERSFAIRLFGERLSLVLMALGIAAVLLLAGQKRRDIFLVPGDWGAAVGGTGSRGGDRPPLRWTVVGPVAALGITALIGGVIVALSRPTGDAFLRITPLLPAILLLALMNAFGEELAFRAAPLSQLWTVVGTDQAIWMTAAWFGLGHYYGGIPSGPVGAVSLTLIAGFFGKAMTETKGLSMPVFIHVWGDIVVYTVLAMSA